MAPNLAVAQAGRQATRKATEASIMHSPEPTMPLLAISLVQVAGWVGPAAALALILIAVCQVAVAVVAALMAKEFSETTGELTEEVRQIRRDIEPTLEKVREVAEAGKGLANKVETEVSEILRTSQRVRHEVDRGFRRAGRRLSDLDALAEVVQGELEETALDVAATLRTVRRGKGVLGRIRRLVRGRR